MDGIPVFPYHEARDAITALLRYIGEDPEREGLRETPDRVLRSYAELFSGYRTDVASLFKTFEDVTCNEIVLLKEVSFYSTCEHHLLTFSGVAHIAYLPDKKVLGISKLVRVLEVYARRLQIQERLCEQVTAALETYLSPQGSACVIAATHSCMSCRGVNKQQAIMVTSSLKGAFLKPEVRAEFYSLIKG